MVIRKRKLPPGITRLSSTKSRVHGYRVRLHYDRGQPRHQSFFPKARYGSWALALAAAVKWREERV